LLLSSSFMYFPQECRRHRTTVSHWPASMVLSSLQWLVVYVRPASYKSCSKGTCFDAAF
jgi:hypothetical protein